MAASARPLDNSAWGFQSNCFVCEPSNRSGLGIQFFHDEAADTVFARFNLSAAFSGAPKLLHGGVVLAILDEAMAWAAVALVQRFALVRLTSTDFRHPVRVDDDYRVEARIDGHDGEEVAASAHIFDAAGRICAVSNATLVVMSPDVASSAIGDVTGTDAAYLGSGS